MSSFNNSVRSVYVNDNKVAVELSDGTLKLYKYQKEDATSDSILKSIADSGRKFEPAAVSAPTITSTMQSMSAEEKAVVAKLLNVASNNKAAPEQVIAEISSALKKSQS
jgi:hypothetical protein